MSDDPASLNSLEAELFSSLAADDDKFRRQMEEKSSRERDSEAIRKAHEAEEAARRKRWEERRRKRKARLAENRATINDALRREGRLEEGDEEEKPAPPAPQLDLDLDLGDDGSGGGKRVGSGGGSALLRGTKTSFGVDLGVGRRRRRRGEEKEEEEEEEEGSVDLLKMAAAAAAATPPVVAETVAEKKKTEPIVPTPTPPKVPAEKQPEEEQQPIPVVPVPEPTQEEEEEEEEEETVVDDDDSEDTEASYLKSELSHSSTLIATLEMQLAQAEKKAKKLTNTNATIRRLRTDLANSDSIIGELRAEIAALKISIRKLREQSLAHLESAANSEAVRAEVASLPTKSQIALKRASVSIGQRVAKRLETGGAAGTGVDGKVDRLLAKMKKLEERKKRLEKEARESRRKEKRLAAQVGSLQKKLRKSQKAAASRSADGGRSRKKKQQQVESELAIAKKKHIRAKTLSKRRFGLFFRKEVCKLEDDLQTANEELQNQKKEAELLKKLLLAVQSPESLYYCAKTDIRQVLPIIMKHVAYTPHNKARMLQEVKHHEFLSSCPSADRYVRLYGHIDFPAESRFTLFMEQMDGDMLKVLLSADEKVSLSQRVLCMADAAEAVRQMHAEGRCHLDLKPQNCFVSKRKKGEEEEEEEGEEKGSSNFIVKLGDFGEVRVVGRAEDASFQSSTGTFRYMDPTIIDLVESGEPDPNLCARDIFSFGMTLFHVTAGLPPLNSFMTLQMKTNPFFNPKQLPSKVNQHLKANPGTSVVDLLFLGHKEGEGPESVLPGAVFDVVRSCLLRESDQRPPMSEVVQKLRGEGLASVGPFLAAKKKKRREEEVELAATGGGMGGRKVAEAESEAEKRKRQQVEKEKEEERRALLDRVEILEGDCEEKDAEIAALRLELADLRRKREEEEEEEGETSPLFTPDPDGDDLSDGGEEEVMVLFQKKKKKSEPEPEPEPEPEEPEQQEEESEEEEDSEMDLKGLQLLTAKTRRSRPRPRHRRRASDGEMLLDPAMADWSLSLRLRDLAERKKDLADRKKRI